MSNKNAQLILLISVSGLMACTNAAKQDPAVNATANTSLNAMALNTVTYTANGSDFRNPERGFYADSEYYDSAPETLTAAALQSLVSSQAGYQVSLVHRSYFLPGSIPRTHLTAGFVTTVRNDLAAARAAGVKLILRFAYRTVALEDCNNLPPAEQPACIARANAEHDPSKQQILNHLEDLRGALTDNADVIAYVDAGLLGTYGEWAYANDQGVGSLLWGFNNKLQPDSQYGYADGTVVNQNTQAVIQKFLDVLPGTRAIAIRNPAQRITLLQGYPDASVTAPGLADAYDPRGWNPTKAMQTTITDATAFQDTNTARLGAHNDCFLASSDDAGTYYYGNYPNVTTATQIANEKQYLSNNNLYVPMGGETCALHPDYDLTNPQRKLAFEAYAKKELRKLRWSTLNTGYNTDVLAAIGSALTEAKLNLGYRFALLSSSLPTTATPNQTIDVQFKIRNDGYAPPYNPRNLEVVFIKSGSAAIRRNVTLSRTSTVNTDPRFWKPATINANGSTTAVTYTVNASVSVPATAGDYTVWLNLPDPALANNPKYSIRLAYNGTWNATTGFNPLNQTIKVQ
jgi:hypothetical protein